MPPVVLCHHDDYYYCHVDHHIVDDDHNRVDDDHDQSLFIIQLTFDHNEMITW